MRVKTPEEWASIWRKKISDETSFPVHHHTLDILESTVAQVIREAINEYEGKENGETSEG